MADTYTGNTVQQVAGFVQSS